MSQEDAARGGAKEALGADLVIPAVAAAFAIYFLASVSDLAWEARATGMLVGLTLLGLIVLLIVRVARRIAAGTATLAITGLVGPFPHGRQRAAIVVLCAVFIALVPWLGLTLGLFALTAALMFSLGAGRWRTVLATSGAVSVAAYVLFIALLNTRMPRGPVERLLASLF